MNDRQIAFVMCVNNNQYCEECIKYINDLEVPEGYSIDVISIEEAESMAQGYNAAMQASDAKYKVYMHQDVFIVNKRFIHDMLEIFANDKSIGMIGVMGTDMVPIHGEWYCAWTCGKVRGFSGKRDFLFDNYDGEGICKRVLAIDGMLMATQYDIPWREEVFDGWDFYDISQSFEMLLAGYKVVIPKQDREWLYHDVGILGMKKYDYYKELFIKEYKNQLVGMTIKTENHDIRKGRIKMADEIADTVMQLAPKRCYAEIKKVLEELNSVYLNNTLCEVMALADIYLSEEKKDDSPSHSEWFYKKSWDEIYESYNDVRLIMLRIEYEAVADERIELLRQKVKKGIITETAVIKIADRLFNEPDKVKKVILA